MADKRTTPKGRPTPSRRERVAARQATAQRQRRLRFGLIGLGVAIVVGVGLLAFAGQESQSGETDALAWDLPAIQGDGRLSLADFEGKPLVVNFFASWCTACDAELPFFASISEEVQDEVTFVGVNSLETGDRLLMPERHNITWWPLARDIGGASGSGLHDSLGMRPGSLPGTAFYSADGELLQSIPGAVTEGQLRDALVTHYDVEPVAA